MEEQRMAAAGITRERGREPDGLAETASASGRTEARGLSRSRPWVRLESTHPMVARGPGTRIPKDPDRALSQGRIVAAS